MSATFLCFFLNMFITFLSSTNRRNAVQMAVYLQTHTKQGWDQSSGSCITCTFPRVGGLGIQARFTPVLIVSKAGLQGNQIQIHTPSKVDKYKYTNTSHKVDIWSDCWLWYRLYHMGSHIKISIATMCLKNRWFRENEELAGAASVKSSPYWSTSFTAAPFLCKDWFFLF